MKFFLLKLSALASLYTASADAICIVPMFPEALWTTSSTFSSNQEEQAGPATASEKFNLSRKILSAGDMLEAKSAYTLMKEAADSEYLEAYGGLGFFYAHGIAVKQNLDTAIAWMRKGAELGDVKAQHNLGMLLVSDQNNSERFAEGKALIEKAAATGLAEAQFSLGRIHLVGSSNARPDYQSAYKQYRLAAESGHAGAQYSIGELYEKGLGRKADMHSAEDWYRKAATAGNAEAQNRLGHLLFHHTGVQKRVECTYWLMLAAEQKHVEAQKLLDEVLLTINEKDLAEACIRVAKFKRKGNASQMVSHR